MQHTSMQCLEMCMISGRRSFGQAFFSDRVRLCTSVLLQTPAGQPDSLLHACIPKQTANCVPSNLTRRRLIMC